MDALPKALPKVANTLTKSERRSARFVRPALGKEIKVLHGEDNGESPKSNVMAVRLMTLQPCSVVPYHKHEKKEKFYIFRGPGHLEVVIFFGENAKTFLLVAGEELVIPAGCPHCVKYFHHLGGPCETLIIISSQDGTDIYWEEDAEELVLNKHLIRKGE